MRGRVGALWLSPPFIANLLWLSAAIACPSSALSPSGVGPEGIGRLEETSPDGGAIRRLGLVVRQRISGESK